MDFASSIKPFAKTRILLKLQDLSIDQEQEKATKDRQIKLIKSELDPDIVRRFERLIARDGQALWDIKNGACSGCMLRLSNKYDQIVKMSKNIFICEHCGRFIYYPNTK
jgi:predicted  nucleic acid-binding Zn-ribbon protein